MKYEEVEKIIGGVENLNKIQRQILSKTLQDNEKVLFSVRETGKYGFPYNALIALNDRLVYVVTPNDYCEYRLKSIEYIDIHSIDLDCLTMQQFKKDLSYSGPLKLTIGYKGTAVGLYFAHKYEHQVLQFAEWLRKLVREKS